MKKRRKVKILLIEWVDSAGDPGWQHTEDIKAHLAHCQTVGFLVTETKEAIALALSRTTSNGFKPFGDIISIPKISITSKRVLSKVKAPK